MAYQLRTLAAPAEGLDLVCCPHRVTHNHWNTSFKRAEALFWSLQALGMYMIYIHTCRQTLIDIKLKGNTSLKDRNQAILSSGVGA